MSELTDKCDKIWAAIAECFPIDDVIWYNDTTTLYDQIYFIMEGTDQ